MENLRAGAAHVSVAFAPGHVTGIFAPAQSNRDPRARGSVGAGLVLDIGVTAVAQWRPAKSAQIVVRSDTRHPLRISRDVALRLAIARRGRLELALHHGLPIGQGFGMSSAGALATALAVASVLKIKRARAVEIAHLADLFGGGGLGGVAAILGGGLELRRRPGIPPFGRITHQPMRRPCVIGILGDPIPSPGLLTAPDFLRRVTIAARPGLMRLSHRFTLRSFLEESERFADHLGLAPRPLSRLMHSVRTPDLSICQAMFGRSFFAVPWNHSARRRLFQELARKKVRALEVRSPPVGAWCRRVSRPERQAF